MGGSSAVTRVLLSRGFGPPWYQLKTHNTPVRHSSSLRKLGGKQKKRLYWFPSTTKWIQGRLSIHGVCFNCNTLFPFSITGFTISTRQRSRLEGVDKHRHSSLEQLTAATDGTERTFWKCCFAEAKAALLLCDYILCFLKFPTGNWDC